MRIVDEIIQLYEERGRRMYNGEAVTQTEHAVQAALLAEDEGTTDAMIVAALLHDIGHLLHSGSETLVDVGVDARHEEIGARWLARHFAPDVCEPVRLHVLAKRHLCGSDPAYAAALSVASQHSLALQGGALDPSAQRSFLTHPFARRAVRLRKWDEDAKAVDMALPLITGSSRSQGPVRPASAPPQSAVGTPTGWSGRGSSRSNRR